jgi:hypothetical protein
LRLCARALVRACFALLEIDARGAVPRFARADLFSIKIYPLSVYELCLK